MITPSLAQVKSALLVLNGEVGLELSHFHRLLSQADFIVCADGAVRHLTNLGVNPQLIIGDLDSIDAHLLEEAKLAGVAVIEHTDQELGDFEKALTWLKNENFESVEVIGMNGGRTDHTLSNLSVMLRFADAFKHISAHEKENTVGILTHESTREVTGWSGRRVSGWLVPARARADSGSGPG